MLLLFLVSGAVLLAGCDDRQEILARQMEDLRREIAQLKAASANGAVMMEDMQNKLLLLEDQVDSTRLLVSRAAPPRAVAAADLSSSFGLPVVRVAPRGRAEEKPPAEAPPPVVVFQQLDENGQIVEDGESAKDQTGSGSGDGRPGAGEAGPGDGGAPASYTSGGSAGSRPRPAFDSRPIVLYNQSYDLLRAKQHAEAIAGFERFLDQYPNHDYSDNALYWMGEAYYDLQNYAKALECFQKLVALYQDGNKVPDAMLKSALCYRNTGQMDAARELMDRLVAAFPTTTAANIARKKLAELQ